MSSLEGATYQKVTLSWEKLGVSIRTKKASKNFLQNFNVFARETTVEIIKDVTGWAQAGEMLAIMGASGTGKSTMLNALTGRFVKNLKTEGTILVNGTPFLPKDISKVSAYVPQFQSFIGCLTVTEHLYFVSRLKLPSRNYEDGQRKKVVDQIISEMHLEKCRDNFISLPRRNQRISGGEMKRLALASQILNEAPLLVCDEPTSGLDHYLAAEVVGVLRNLADKGKTVICTIHQPSSSSFGKFDRVLLLSQGRLAFFGQPRDALIFFKSLGFSCPDNFNPADFFVRLLAIQPGQVALCQDRVRMIQSEFRKSPYALACQPTFPERSGENPSVQMTRIGDKGAEWRAILSQQMTALLWRSFLVGRRKFRNMIGLEATSWTVTLCASALFWNPGIGVSFRAKEAVDLCGALVFFVNFFNALNMNREVFSLMTEFPPIFQENRAGMYSCFAYVTTKLVSEMPLDVASTFLHSLIFYWSVGLYQSGSAFAIFLLIMILSAICSKTMGFLFVCLIDSWVILRAIVPPIMLSFNLMSGYFINTKDVNWIVSLFRDISFMHYSMEAFMANQWRNIPFIECSGAINNEEATCFESGKALLDYYGFSQENIWRDCAVLGLMSLILYTIASLVLYVRLRKNKN